jgi:CheY-like chemotaxis protein
MTNRPAPIEILLADDDADDALLFREALKDAKAINARLTWIEDGDKLMRYLTTTETYQPDIIFLDINMPGTGGKECLKAIRSHSRFDAIPVAMFSTSLHEDDIRDTFSDGANLYVCKRVFFEHEVEILEQLFATGWRQKLQLRDKKKYVLKVPDFSSN